MSKLQNKIAVVTGGTSGIGLAAAKRFIAEGAHVYITGRRQAELDAAVAELGERATGIQGDVSDLTALDRLYEAVQAGHGRVDVVFANAGGGRLVPLGEITEAHVDATFGTNVKGLIFTVQKALPLMAPGGTIVLNASTTSIMGTPAFSVYSATKAAVRALARSWVYDLKDRGLRVNVLSPGPTRTPALEGVVPNADEVFSAAVPMGRLGDPDEIAKVAVFLASEDSSFVNGAEVFVDGGLAQV